MMSSAAGTTDLFLLPVHGIQGKLSLMPPCRLPSTITDHFWVCLCQFLWTLPSAAGLVYVAHCLPVSTDPSTSYPKDAFFDFGFVLFVLNPSKAPLTNPDELSLEIYCQPHNGPSLPPLRVPFSHHKTPCSGLWASECPAESLFFPYLLYPINFCLSIQLLLPRKSSLAES